MWQPYPQPRYCTVPVGTYSTPQYEAQNAPVAVRLARRGSRALGRWLGSDGRCTLTARRPTHRGGECGDAAGPVAPL